MSEYSDTNLSENSVLYENYVLVESSARLASLYGLYSRRDACCYQTPTTIERERLSSERRPKGHLPIPYRIITCLNNKKKINRFTFEYDEHERQRVMKKLPSSYLTDTQKNWFCYKK